MKAIVVRIQIILVAVMIIPVIGFCQIQDNSYKEKLESVAKDIINNAKSCALISIDKEGAPRVRTMEPFPVEDDFTVWFGTNSNSRKVEQIKNDARVTLYYLEKEDAGYVVISGIATLVNDEFYKNKYWKKSWEAYYQENKENFSLIKVTPIWMEILSPPNNIYNDSVTWTPPVVRFKNTD